MKIGLVQSSLDIYGGSTRRTVELANALVEAGHDVCIYTRQGEPSSWLICHARLDVISNMRRATLDALAVLTHERDVFDKADQVQAGVHLFYVLGLGEQNLAEIKVELTDPANGALAAAIYSEKWRLVANSTWQSQWLEVNFSKKCPIVFGGINREIFRRPSRVRPNYVVGYSGDPRPRKGTANVTAAIALARPYIPMITSQFYFHKNIPQARMADWYASCTVFVDGQQWAGWNNPVLEAMACGTAVVCTDIGGVRDFAKHKSTAWVVPPTNIPLMADGIVNLFSDATVRRRLAENAHNWVQRFTWAACAEQFIAACGPNLKVLQTG